MLAVRGWACSRSSSIHHVTLEPMRIALAFVTLLLLLGAYRPASRSGSGAPVIQPQVLPQEVHLRNLRQLTFGGENAEAYFSADGRKLSFQSTREGRACDQIYTMNTDGSGVRMVSNGTGRTTCAYFLPDGKRVL